MGTVDSDSELVTALRARGQRVTPQRLVIYRERRRADRPLSADELRDAVSEQLPGLSPPTVYATLELFEQLGVVRRVPVDSGPQLYDTRTDSHHHFHCRRCGRVEDLDLAAGFDSALPPARGLGLRADEAQVTV